MSYQLFSESLTFAERLSIASALKRQLAQVEAEVAEGIGRTQVVIAVESFHGNFVADAPRIVGATHSLTIAFDEFSVTARRAFLEYGAICEAMDSAYVLRHSLCRFTKKRNLPLSGSVRIVLANTGVYGDSLGVMFGFGEPIECDRFKIAFHGAVDLTQSSPEWFAQEFVREHFLMKPKQVVLSRLNEALPHRFH